MRRDSLDYRKVPVWARDISIFSNRVVDGGSWGFCRCLLEGARGSPSGWAVGPALWGMGILDDRTSPISPVVEIAVL